jgi:hypothetical protein
MHAALTVLLFAVLAGCQQPRDLTLDIKKDHAAIKQLADSALVSEEPLRSLQALLPKIRSFPAVDSAWMSGSALFVRYRGGGLVSWSAAKNDVNR